MGLPIRRFGSTGWELTKIGLGTWALGGGDWAFGWGPQDDAESIATIHHAVEAGINWLDTAPEYGLGHSEEIVGRALAAMSDADRPLVFTKCAMVWDPNDRHVEATAVGDAAALQLTDDDLDTIAVAIASTGAGSGPARPAIMGVL